MTKKIIVKLNGGLGNQMFQYAFAKSMAMKFGLDIVFDYSYFEEVKNGSIVATRYYELGFFNLECPQVLSEDLKNVRRPDFNSKFKNTLAKKFPSFFGVNYVREKKNYLFEKKLVNPNYLFYDGYFQNEKYFKNIKNELLKDFSLKAALDEKNQDMLEKIKASASVSLHIRRGDYVTIKEAKEIHGCCSLDYYKNAVELIAKTVKNPHFYIFSDDVQWVIDNLKLEYPFTVVDFNQNQGWFDLELMKNCKHNIVANSSFSWWGAWLNTNADKIVIAPEKWLAVKQKCDIVPKNWIKI